MNRKEAEERAVHLVDQMTVEEMASQLRYDAPAIERLHITGGVKDFMVWQEPELQPYFHRQ